MNSQTPKIITLTHEFYPQRGGIAIYTEEVARAAHRLGYAIEVWAPARKGLAPDRFPFPIRQLPIKGTQDWPCRIKLTKYLYQHRQEWNGQSLYLPEPGPIRTWMYLQGMSASRVGKINITLHGSEIERFTQPFYRKILFGKLLRKAHRIGVVSRYSQKLLLNHYPYLRDKIILTPGALRSDFKKPTPKLHESKEDITLLTVGRIHPRKGQDFVLKALARLPRELRNRINYLMAGPIVKKDFAEQLKSYIQKHRLRATLMGCIEDDKLASLYAKADIFIMTSKEAKKSVEGFGLTYLEASAHGLPVIAHRTGGVADAVRNSKTGIKINPGNLDDLTQAISTLAMHPEIRQSMGKSGYEWVTNFSWDNVAKNLFSETLES